MKKLILTLAAVASFGFVNAQQVIGEFPLMEGGAEGIATTESLGGTGSGGSSPVFDNWTRSSSAQSVQAIRESDPLVLEARTGEKYAAFSLGTASNGRIQPVCQQDGVIMPNTEYTVQFYVNASTSETLLDGTNQSLTGSIYLGGTSSSTGGASVHGALTVEGSNVNNTWVKTHTTITSGESVNVGFANFVAVRIPNTNFLGPDDAVNVDDIVLYAGSYDSTAPDAPTSVTGTYTSSGALSWTAPATGVDGGGYVVVKYPSTAAADTDINQNGIYQVGNTTAAGTIVYIGTDTSFTDTYTAGAEYKVFTADKAFNYSAGLTLTEDTTLSLGDLTINGEELSAGPVPMMDTLTISGDVDSTTLYALNGSIVATSLSNSIDVASLPKGVYLLQIAIDDQTAFTKVVK